MSEHGRREVEVRVIYPPAFGLGWKEGSQGGGPFRDFSRFWAATLFSSQRSEDRLKNGLGGSTLELRCGPVLRGGNPRE